MRLSGTRRSGSRRTVGCRDDFGVGYVRLHQAVYANLALYEADRDELMRLGRAGDIGALCILWERWKFRLPAVEGKLVFTMPWMGRNARTPEATRRG